MCIRNAGGGRKYREFLRKKAEKAHAMKRAEAGGRRSRDKFGSKIKRK